MHFFSQKSHSNNASDIVVNNFAHLVLLLSSPPNLMLSSLWRRQELVVQEVRRHEMEQAKADQVNTWYCIPGIHEVLVTSSKGIINIKAPRY